MPSSGGFNNLIGSMRTAGLLDIPIPSRVAPIADGVAQIGVTIFGEEARGGAQRQC
jgi:hypothetical protein